MQQRLLTLYEHIHKPFVERLIVLLVSGLIALLLGGASFTNLTQWPLSTVTSISANTNV